MLKKEKVMRIACNLAFCLLETNIIHILLYIITLLWINWLHRQVKICINCREMLTNCHLRHFVLSHCFISKHKNYRSLIVFVQHVRYPDIINENNYFQVWYKNIVLNSYISFQISYIPVCFFKYLSSSHVFY